MRRKKDDRIERERGQKKGKSREKQEETTLIQLALSKVWGKVQVGAPAKIRAIDKRKDDQDKDGGGRKARWRMERGLGGLLVRGRKRVADSRGLWQVRWDE